MNEAKTIITLIRVKMILAFSLAKKWEPIVITESWECPELDEFLEEWNGYAGPDEEEEAILASLKAKHGERIPGLQALKKHAEPGVYLYIGSYNTSFSTDATSGGMDHCTGTLAPLKLTADVVAMVESKDAGK